MIARIDLIFMAIFLGMAAWSLAAGFTEKDFAPNPNPWLITHGFVCIAIAFVFYLCVRHARKQSVIDEYNGN